MAERRPPGFNVDLGFYDSEEVLSIPRKFRLAAVGLWTLCGAYSANKLTDGYVNAEALRERGCTPALRLALLSTKPEPLWVDAGNGAIRFTRWAKWQRTEEEVKSYRDADAERKRKARAARSKDRPTTGQASPDDRATTGRRPGEAYVVNQPIAGQSLRNEDEPPLSWDDSNVSYRTSSGRSQPVRPDSGTPKTETETETKRMTQVIPPVTVSGRATGAEIARSRIAGLPSRSGIAYRIAQAFSDSQPVPIETGVRTEIAGVIDRCLSDQIPPDAIAAGIQAWVSSDSWAPSQIPKFVAKATARNAPRNGHGKPTEKALGYDDAAEKLIAALEVNP